MTGTDKPTQLVFIISLPRSGSTLLQRMLASHPEVASCAEPWLMLPLISMMESGCQGADFGHETCVEALGYLVEALPGGRSSMDGIVGDFGREIYTRLSAASGASIFLDKTPRYYLIFKHLLRIYPDAKFIFLYRQPLAVAASIFRTWYKNKLDDELKRNFIDIIHGPFYMAEARKEARGNVVHVMYDEFVSDPESGLRRICEFLGIQFLPDMVTDYLSEPIEIKIGDPLAAAEYGAVTTEPTGKWRSFYVTPARRWLARKYVDWLGVDVLEAFGTSAAALLEELSVEQVRWKGNLDDLTGILKLKWALRKGGGCMARADLPAEVAMKLGRVPFT